MKIEIKNVLWKDFFENHFPESYALLDETLNKYQECKDIEKNLLLNLKREVQKVINNLSESNDEIINLKCSENLASRIFRKTWNPTMVRIAVYNGSAYIYFSPKKDDAVRFGDPNDDSTILQVKGSDSELSKERASAIRSRIIDRIDKIAKNSASDLDDYNNKEILFQSSKDNLLTELLRIRYSTNLRIKKYNPKRKCLFL